MADEWKMRWPDPETKVRWQAAAKEWGVSLAEYVRVAVEEKIESRSAPPLKVTPIVVPSAGKRFTGPDPRVKPRPK